LIFIYHPKHRDDFPEMVRDPGMSYVDAKYSFFICYPLRDWNYSPAGIT
jgi:hypothetical protein